MPNVCFCLAPNPMPRAKVHSRLSIPTQPPVTKFWDNTALKDVGLRAVPFKILRGRGRMENFAEPLSTPFPHLMFLPYCQQHKCLQCSTITVTHVRIARESSTALSTCIKSSFCFYPSPQNYCLYVTYSRSWLRWYSASISLHPDK